MIETVINFYNNLFAIEITVFGIIAATIFVFLQIVYSQFSYREVGVIFKNIYLVLYLFLSTTTLLLTAAGSLFLSFSASNLISKSDFILGAIFLNREIASVILLFFFISLILFIFLVLSNLRYMRPSMIALLIGNKIKTKQISNFLLKKYGVPEPDRWILSADLYKDISKDNLFKYLNIKILGKKNYKLTKEEQEEIEKREKEIENKIVTYKENYDRIKKEIEQSKNPFEPLEALLLKAINSVDLKIVEEVYSILIKTSKYFIESHGTNYKDDWSPNYGIVEKYLNHLIETLRLYMDMCDRQHLEVVEIQILEASKNITPQLLIRNNQLEIKIILAFWKEVADRAIGNSPQIFGKVIRLYRDLGDYAFEKGVEINKEWLDEIFRNLGWLGERLLSKKGIEEKPIMSDDYYSTEYDQLFNALFSYSYGYNNEYPESYPLIYFDAIYVIFLQLISRYKEDRNYGVKNNIFDCMYTYSSFAKEAIAKGNSNGAALATMRLKECYEHLIKEGLEESAKEAIELLVSVGGQAAGYKGKLGGVEFLPKKIDEYIIDIIEASPFRDAINSEIKEIYIKGGGDRDGIWEFIKALGKRMETNFGFMFDWETGELYAENDPRRY